MTNMKNLKDNTDWENEQHYSAEDLLKFYNATDIDKDPMIFAHLVDCEDCRTTMVGIVEIASDYGSKEETMSALSGLADASFKELESKKKDSDFANTQKGNKIINIFSRRSIVSGAMAACILILVSIFIIKPNSNQGLLTDNKKELDAFYDEHKSDQELSIELLQKSLQKKGFTSPIEISPKVDTINSQIRNRIVVDGKELIVVREIETQRIDTQVIAAPFVNGVTERIVSDRTLNDHFHLGLIYYQDEKYELAKKYFVPIFHLGIKKQPIQSAIYLINMAQKNIDVENSELYKDYLFNHINDPNLSKQERRAIRKLLNHE